MTIGFVKDVIDKLIRLQAKLIPEAEPYMDDDLIQKGRTSLLRVVGHGGENLLLYVKNGHLGYANKKTKPYHVFKCTIDTFISLLTGDVTMREVITKKQFVIEDAKTHSIDLVECERWAKAFQKLGGLFRKAVGM